MYVHKFYFVSNVLKNVLKNVFSKVKQGVFRSCVLKCQIAVYSIIFYSIYIHKMFIYNLQAVATVGASLPVEVIPELLEAERPLMRFRCVADPEILEIIIQVFQSLLSLKNMPLLEKIYKLVWWVFFLDSWKRKLKVRLVFWSFICWLEKFIWLI